MRHLGLSLIGAALLAGAGCGASSRPVPGRAVGNIDESAASYRGIHLGMHSAAVAVLLGAPLPRHDDPYLPTRSKPPFLPADTPADFVYPDVTMTFVNDRVASMTVYGQGAATRRGVGLGSPLSAVTDEYRRARCVPGHGGPEPQDPGCQVKLGTGRYLYFSGDPVTDIALSNYPPATGALRSRLP